MEIVPYLSMRTVPEMSEEKIPKLGQEFGSIKDAFDFYNNYAYHAGFSVRYGSSKVSKVTKKLLRKEFFCFKQGGRENINVNAKRKRGLTRQKCMAKLAVVRSGTGFIVKQFVDAHNHVLETPSQTHLLRSHRTGSSAKRALTQQLSARNVIDGSGHVCDTSLMVRYNSLFRLASNVIENAVMNEEASKLVQDELESLHRKVKLMTQNTNSTVSTSGVAPLDVRAYKNLHDVDLDDDDDDDDDAEEDMQ